MLNSSKSPLAFPDFRFFWWQDYTDFLKKIARELESELYDTFRYNQFGEEPDNDAAAANLIFNGLQALINVAQSQTDKSRINLSKYEDFCEYWVNGNGTWNGIHEFLSEEAQ